MLGSYEVTVPWEKFSPMSTSLACAHCLRIARKTRGLLFPVILFYFSFPGSRRRVHWQSSLTFDRVALFVL